MRWASSAGGLTLAYVLVTSCEQSRPARSVQGKESDAVQADSDQRLGNSDTMKGPRRDFAQPAEPWTWALLRAPASGPDNTRIPMYEVVVHVLPEHRQEYVIVPMGVGMAISLDWYSKSFRFGELGSLVAGIRALPLDAAVYAGDSTTSAVTGAPLRGLYPAEIEEIQAMLLPHPPDR